jgi:hypothetical protein
MNVDKSHLEGISRGKRNLFDYEVSFLILDYNKPEETKALLGSIFKYTQFDNYQIVLFSNGGQQDYVIDLYEKGYIDKLILSKKNYGCGGGTHAIFDNADAPFALYVQNDQYMCRDFHFEELKQMKESLRENICIDLSGGAGHSDKYSERAHIVDVERFKGNPDKGYGGPGPFDKICWSEEMTQLFFAEGGDTVDHGWPMLFGNNGRYSVREDLDGNVTRTDLVTGNKEENYTL